MNISNALALAAFNGEQTIVIVGLNMLLAIPLLTDWGD